MTSEKQNAADSYHNFSEFYDLYVGDFLDDLPMYEKYAVQVGGSVLEIGAGSGRLTIPLAQTGFDVAAMDVSATMLAILDDRLKGLPAVVRNRVQIIQADVCELELGAKFGLVMVPYYVFNYLLTPGAQSQALARIKAHLADSALVIVDAFIPIKRLASPDERQIRRPDVVDPATGNRIRSWNTFRLDTQSSIEYRFQRFEIESPNGELRVKEFTVERRYTLADDLERLFLSHGFKVSEVFTGYRGEPPQPDSEQLVYVLGVD